MNDERVSKILEKVKDGTLSIKKAEKRIDSIISKQVGSDLLFDISRENISGIPEVVLAEPKAPQICIKAAQSIVKEKGILLFTRCKEKHFEAFEQWENPQKYVIDTKKVARTVLVYKRGHNFDVDVQKGAVALITAGTTDIPIAKEAEITLKSMNITVKTFYDVGIAGLHRLQNPIQEIRDLAPKCIIVFAGMEGALPSVVAGLVSVPVIGVPISSGSYGYGSGGKAALMSMLQSCSPGLAVVNIDGGFRAATIAALIVKNA